MSASSQQSHPPTYPSTTLAARPSCDSLDAMLAQTRLASRSEVDDGGREGRRGEREERERNGEEHGEARGRKRSWRPHVAYESQGSRVSTRAIYGEMAARLPHRPALTTTYGHCSSTRNDDPKTLPIAHRHHCNDHAASHSRAYALTLTHTQSTRPHRPLRSSRIRLASIAGARRRR